MLPCWCSVATTSLVVVSLLGSSLAIPSSSGSGSYDLVDSFQGDSFFDGFDFFTGEDPTHGFVNYLDRASAEAAGLVSVQSNGSVHMGVDSITMLSPNGPGRNSVRIESKKMYDTGLFIADLTHMPGNACGIWPAFWTLGPNWPTHGEIDILEAVNLMTSNQVTLHASGNCDISANNMAGGVAGGACGQGQGSHNVGCVVGAPGTFGTPFNDVGGGVYAMELTDSRIAVWFFPRSAIPTSITNSHIDVATLGTPMASFQGSCSLTDIFNQQRVVFDTTFCGDWAGNQFAESGCPMTGAGNSTQNCVSYVASNPSDYAEAFWEIVSLRIYQGGANPSVFPSATASSSSVSIASSSEVASSPRPGVLGSLHRRTSAVAPTNVTIFRSSIGPVAPTPSSSSLRVGGAMATSLMASSHHVSAPLVQSSQSNTPSSAAQSSQFVSSTSKHCPRDLGDAHCISGSTVTATTIDPGATSISDSTIVVPGASTGFSRKAPVNPLADPAAKQPTVAQADPPADPPGNTPLDPSTQQPGSDQPAGHPANSSAGPPTTSPPRAPSHSPTIPTAPGGSRPSVPGPIGPIPFPLNSTSMPFPVNTSIPIANHTRTRTPGTPSLPLITSSRPTSMLTVPAGGAPSTTPAPRPPTPIFTGAANKLSSGFSGMLCAAAAVILI